ncbi:hypothetical protein OEZ85_010692 [Tetradesmus obliquus]|uniref:BAP29/BAP31 transmembrane domain-containing protein n=1 Tax=Tetradesmus obliquus TaxID=3088 RepID=A0ABY8TSR6_TETOB|nr:hypothetical protein OEZ85_010692 [Tetradesmus obliquus]
MGPGNTFDPVWTLMTMFTIMEVVIVALLVMPMPSNKVRGMVQGTINKFWHSQEYVKKTSWVMLTLNSYYVYDSARQLIQHNKIYAASCEAYSLALYFQRNLLISGGSVFLFFVMRRLLDIQGQLFETRALAKEAAVQQQQLLDSQPSGAPASEQHRKLQHMLSKLDRAISNVSGDGEAAAAAVRAAKLN